MLNEMPSGSTRIVTALKIAAVVTVLGSVVFAAEHQLASVVPHAQTIAAPIATVHQAPAADGAAQQTATDYFPAQFPAPTAQASEPMPTF
jgi:hypothetical protein